MSNWRIPCPAARRYRLYVPRGIGVVKMSHSYQQLELGFSALSLPQSTPVSSRPTFGRRRVVAGYFAGTRNPRHLRALYALLRRPLLREELDLVTGASNSPDLVAQLRRRGLRIPCSRVQVLDIDGRPCWPGVYRLTRSDRWAVLRWLATKPSPCPSSCPSRSRHRRN